MLIESETLKAALIFNDKTGEITVPNMREVFRVIDSQPHPWHRVEEPPKEEGKYLVCDGRGNYYVAWWGLRLGWCYDPKFFCYWMPIEPPKEDADANK